MTQLPLHSHILSCFASLQTFPSQKNRGESTEEARGKSQKMMLCPTLSHDVHYKQANQAKLTPLRRDVMATTGDHWFVRGLYLSALLSSVVSSLPPTAYIMSWYTAQPRCFLLVPMGAIVCQRFSWGLYRSTAEEVTFLDNRVGKQCYCSICKGTTVSTQQKYNVPVCSVTLMFPFPKKAAILSPVSNPTQSII